NWNLQRLPVSGDQVKITADTTVVYDVNSAARIKVICVDAGARLTFRPDVGTQLLVETMHVEVGGEMDVGTASAPLTASADIVFTAGRIDTVFDPEQFGHGLIGMGTVTVYGRAMSPTFVRLAAEPVVGATTLRLSEPVTGWQPGDRILVPD